MHEPNAASAGAFLRRRLHQPRSSGPVRVAPGECVDPGPEAWIREWVRDLGVGYYAMVFAHLRVVPTVEPRCRGFSSTRPFASTSPRSPWTDEVGDAALMRRLLEGDERALAELVRRYLR